VATEKERVVQRIQPKEFFFNRNVEYKRWKNCPGTKVESRTLTTQDKEGPTALLAIQGKEGLYLYPSNTGKEGPSVPRQHRVKKAYLYPGNTG
jgi:hypothetical protein